MRYATSPSVTRRSIVLLTGGTAVGAAVVLALSQATDARTPVRGTHPTPLPSSQTSFAPHGPQRTLPAQPRPAPSPKSPRLGGFASPNRCIEINHGDWNACNVGNSGRGDLPYRIVRLRRG
jgi:hypothetical protein